jgi:hypothetical protein
VPAEGPGAIRTRDVWEQRYPVFTDRRCHLLRRRFARLARVLAGRLRDAILPFAKRYG